MAVSYTHLISFVLSGYKITIPLTIKKLFHIFKSGRQLIFLIGIFEIAEAIVTVPYCLYFYVSLSKCPSLDLQI